MPKKGQSKHEARDEWRERAQKCTELRAQSYTKSDIARALGIAPGTVSRIFAAMDRKIMARLVEFHTEIRLTQWHEIRWGKAQCTQSWLKSKEPLRRASQTTGADDGDGCTKTDVIERCGDVAYLAEKRAHMREERELMGLNIGPAEQDSDLTVAQLMEDLETRAQAYEASREEGQEGAPPGPEGAPDGGIAEMQGRPGEVQSDGALPGTVLE